MIRITLLTLFVTFLACYAWKDWYKSLCGLILLMAVVEHPDMPKSIMGIQGFSPWNILLAVVVMAWLSQRKKEGLTWDMPGKINVLLFLYFFFVVLSFIRLSFNIDLLAESARTFGQEPETFTSLFSEYIINCIKWVVPAVLLYDGCRNEERFRWGFCAFLLVYVFLALQVIRWMPLSSIGGGESLTHRSLKILSNEVGYHRVNLSMILAGAFWAVIAYSLVVIDKSRVKYIWLIGGVVLFGQALTGGRTGYATWMVISAFMAVLKWRKLILLGPVMVILIIATVPAVQERLLQGFSEDTVDSNKSLEEAGVDLGSDGPHWYTVTAGRSIAWPYVFEKIGEAKLFGYGRDAMKVTGVADYLWINFGESFPHPHNAYLQWVFDNGIPALIPVLLFYFLIYKYSLSLFRDKRSGVFMSIGCSTVSLVSALLIAAVGSQTFYPREGAVGMWCSMALMLRVYVQRSQCSQELDIMLAKKEGYKDSEVQSLIWRENKQESRKWQKRKIS